MGEEDHFVLFEEGSVGVDEDFESDGIDEILQTRGQLFVLRRKSVLHRHHEHASKRFQRELRK